MISSLQRSELIAALHHYITSCPQKTILLLQLYMW
jgi:hypothetical protein